jgi:hypothetical protein
MKKYNKKIKWAYMVALVVLNILIIMLYNAINSMDWPLNSLYIKIFLHLTMCWIVFLFYLDRDSSINFDHKGQYLTKELIDEYKEQNRLDNESCFDECNN